MDDASSGKKSGGCPHVNRNDQRCSNRFSLGRIDQAFCVCFGAYHGCPMYHRINGEHVEPMPHAAELPLIAVTANGTPVPLLATGT